MNGWNFCSVVAKERTYHGAVVNVIETRGLYVCCRHVRPDCEEIWRCAGGIVIYLCVREIGVERRHWQHMLAPVLFHYLSMVGFTNRGVCIFR